LSGDPYRIRTFPVRIENEQVYVELPNAGDIEKLVPIRIADSSCASAATCSATSDAAE
jgi:hypothetical protein